MSNKQSKPHFFRWLFISTILAPVIIWVSAVLISAESLFELLSENKELKAALTHLTTETQIGYAKVTHQETTPDGKTITQLKFVETAPGDLHKTILEHHYEIEGDVIHFDALIVRFNQQMLINEQQKSLYLWRRVYSEHMPPSQGFPIEVEGAEPKRYENLLKEQSWLDKLLLKPDNKKRFWQAIWSLSQNPDQLKKYGISAVYGSAVYQKLRPGLIYVFKINAAGQIYPETIPDL